MDYKFDIKTDSGIISSMKSVTLKTIITLLLGCFLGLLVAGLYWQPKYVKLHNRYINSIELLHILKD